MVSSTDDHEHELVAVRSFAGEKTRHAAARRFGVVTMKVERRCRSTAEAASHFGGKTRAMALEPVVVLLDLEGRRARPERPRSR